MARIAYILLNILQFSLLSYLQACQCWFKNFEAKEAHIFPTFWLSLEHCAFVKIYVKLFGMIGLVLKPEKGFKALQLVRIHCPLIYHSNSEKENSFDEESACIFKVTEEDVALRKSLGNLQVRCLSLTCSRQSLISNC